MILNFNIFKNEHKEKENHPDYVLSTFNKETGEKKKVGACWKKATKAGTGFLSCQYDDERKMEIKEAPKVPSVDVGADINPDDIPFN